MKFPGDAVCSTHGGKEMFVTCSGSEAESLGYCDKWDGTLVGVTETQPQVTVGGEANCVFPTA